MSNKQPISTFLGIAAAVVLVSSSYAADIFVNGTCGNNDWSGLSPVCVALDGPKKAIEKGITAAVNGDVVIVAQGEYFESINFDGKAITVRSTVPANPAVRIPPPKTPLPPVMTKPLRTVSEPSPLLLPHRHQRRRRGQRAGPDRPAAGVRDGVPVGTA